MYQTIARQGICISILREESPNMASALWYCAPIHRINTKCWSLVVGNPHLAFYGNIEGHEVRAVTPSAKANGISWTCFACV